MRPNRNVRGVDRGTAYYLLGGRLVIGPDWKSLLASTCAIGIPAVIFMVFVAPYLGRHISWGLVAGSIALIIIVFVSLALTAFRDPGFYPRSPLDTDVEYGLAPPYREYIVNDYVVKTKYCHTCCHYRPPRVSHCATCDACVDKFDHHCPWVGTCVGRRNYRSFFIFIVATTLLCCWVLALSVVQLWHAAKHRDGGWSVAISDYPASLVLIIYVFFSVWFTGGLSVLHLWFVSRNVTTYEHFRSRYGSTGNPYDRGLLKNIRDAFCTATPPPFQPLAAKQKQEDRAAALGSIPPPPPGEPGCSHLNGDFSNAAREARYDGSVPPSENGGSRQSMATTSGYSEETSAEGDAGHVHATQKERESRGTLNREPAKSIGQGKDVEMGYRTDHVHGGDLSGVAQGVPAAAWDLQSPRTNGKVLQR